MCLTAIARLLLVLDDSSSQVENCAGSVFYVDSNGSFRSSRLLQIMAALRPDADVKVGGKDLTLQTYCIMYLRSSIPGRCNVRGLNFLMGLWRSYGVFVCIGTFL